MRNWKETLQWLRTHKTTAQIGFNPDGMCLKVSRTAREIGSMYLTAKQAQDATPREHRVYNVAELRRGMVLYFDDPHDSNASGHIVTMIGRVKGGDVGELHDVLVKTNSVVSGQLVIVRGDYFRQHWGDSFQFGATWLNGQVLDVPGKTAKQKKAGPTGEARLQNFKETRGEWDIKILDRLVEGPLPRLRDLRHKIDVAVKNLPDDVKDTKVKQFKEHYVKHRVLKMALLNESVKNGRNQRVKRQRDHINAALKSILR